MSSHRGLFKSIRTRQITAAVVVIFCLGVTGMYPVQAGAVSPAGRSLYSIRLAAGALNQNRPAPQLEPTSSPAEIPSTPGQTSSPGGDSIPPFVTAAGTLADPLTIPGRSSATIDASCFGREYRDGVSANFVDGNGATGTIYIKHDQKNLYICMIGAVGSYDQRFASVYLDPNLNRGTFPQADDLSFRANLVNPGTSTLQGGGAPGVYVPVSLAGWKAVTDVSFVDVAEFQIPLAYTGCSSIFGLAVYHHWFAGISNDYGWPVSQFWDQPDTWAVVRLDEPRSQGCAFLPVVSR